MIKTVSLVVILGCVAVLAAPTTPAANINPEIATLLEQVDKICKHAQELIQKCSTDPDTHPVLTNSVKRELKELEYFTRSLQMSLRVHNPDIELNLARVKLHEAQLQQEITFVEAVYKHHKELNMKGNELVEYAEKLLKEAKAVQVIHPHSASFTDLEHLEQQIRDVEALLANYKADQTEHKYPILERLLVRSEMSLKALITRILSSK